MELSINWFGVLEFANFEKISVSTVRRRIKANKLKFKMVDGKYLIYSEIPKIPINSYNKGSKKLELKLKKVIEENNELKMLVRLYEQKLVFPPSIPVKD